MNEIVKGIYERIDGNKDLLNEMRKENHVNHKISEKQEIRMKDIEKDTEK